MRLIILLLGAWTHLSYSLSSASCGCTTDEVSSCQALILGERSSADGSCDRAPNNLSYSFHERFYSQPKITLEKLTPLQSLSDSTFTAGSDIIIVGYKNCNSNPLETYFVNKSNEILALNEATEVEVMLSKRPNPGDTCNFFGCYVYYENLYTACYVKDFMNENFTILWTCTIPRDFGENGSVSFYPPQAGKVVEGTTVNITCDEGFVATSNASVCGENGTWSPNLPQCIRKCPEPNFDNLANYTINYVIPTFEHFIVNTTIEITCWPFHNGSGIITCQEDGTWSREFFCDPIICLQLDDHHGGMLEINAPNYAPQPDNGYLVDTNITLKCPPFYREDKTIRCNSNGEWSSSDPIKCIPVTCPGLNDTLALEISSPDYASQPKGGYLAYTNITLRCPPFHGGDKTIRCDSNGHWNSPHTLKCSPDIATISILVVVMVIVLLIVIPASIFLCKKYWDKRCSVDRRLRRMYTFKVTQEAVNPDHEPINLYQHRALEISLSLQTSNYSYENFGSSTSLSTHRLSDDQVEDMKLNSKVDNDIREEYTHPPDILAKAPCEPQPVLVSGGKIANFPSLQPENATPAEQPDPSSDYQYDAMDERIACLTHSTAVEPEILEVKALHESSELDIQDTDIQLSLLPEKHPLSPESPSDTKQLTSPINLKDVTLAFATVDQKHHKQETRDSIEEQEQPNSDYVNSGASNSECVNPASPVERVGYICASDLVPKSSYITSHTTTAPENDSGLSCYYSCSNHPMYSDSEYLTESDLFTTLHASAQS